MPALTQITTNVGSNYGSRSNFLPKSLTEDQKSFAPTGFALDDLKKGTLDIGKMLDFLSGTPFNRENILKLNRSRFSINDKVVGEAFETYCNQLKAKKVIYHYDANDSPFSSAYKGKSNCRGRATGFLQLMAVLRVKIDSLYYCQLGGGPNDVNKKVCQKSDQDIIGVSVQRLLTTPQDAPNAIRVIIRNEKLIVQRTAREPFAHHYAAYLDVPWLNFKYWDPLERVAYKAGFDDFFTSYARDEELTSSLQKANIKGVVCYSNPDNRKERLYYLPSAAEWRKSVLKSGFGPKSLMGSEAFYNQAAYRAVDGTLREMNGDIGSPLAMIVDLADWGNENGTHPSVVRAMFSMA